jgi:hypothetical protein
MMNIIARDNVPLEAIPAKTSATGRIPITQKISVKEKSALSGVMIWNIMSRIMIARRTIVVIPFQFSFGLTDGAAGFFVAATHGGSVKFPVVLFPDEAFTAVAGTIVEPFVACAVTKSGCQHAIAFRITKAAKAKSLL